MFVVAAVRAEDGAPVAVAVDGDAAGVCVEAVMRYDATRSLGHVSFDGAGGTVLDGVGADALARAWYVGQALLAAESLGAVETALATSVAYAKERFTFGRAIGSYQAVKHSLVEVLRLRENAYSLLVYAGWAYEDGRVGVPAGRERRAVGRRPRAGLREPHDDLRARRHRRDVGARRAAVLPPRPALAPPARRRRRRDRPRRGRAARRGVSARGSRVYTASVEGP